MDFLGKKEKHDMLPVLTFSENSTTNDSTNNAVEITCLKCAQLNKFPDEKDDYLAHLFLEHRLVIADVEEIALLEEYLQFWQNEFLGHELEEYCTTMLLDQLPDGTPARNEKYYLLSDILPKDYELRKTLQKKSLSKALEQHQFERSDRNFCKECLYCRDVIKGLRSEYLEHLFSKHFLLLGKPENLVYVDDLLAKVQNNLEHLICLYCEKIFKDRVTLKEHMRKKAHKRINPSNRAYDKFYLQNYRNEKPIIQQTKSNRNRDIKAGPKTDQNTNHREANAKLPSEQQRKNVTDGEESVDFEQRFVKSDDSDSDWSDWDDGKQTPLNCLFCTQQYTAFSELKQHMHKEHNVDFDMEMKDLNFYQKIKVINYVRRQVCLHRCVICNLRCDTADALHQHMTAEQHYGLSTTTKLWDKPEYFFPTYEDDGLLCILDDSPNDDLSDTVVPIISEDTLAQINKDAERLSLENFKF